MTNITNATALMEANYNLTSILSNDIIENPQDFISTLNDALGGYLILSLVCIIGFVLYMSLINKDDPENPTTALVYTFFVCDIIMILLFFVSVTGGGKLVSWSTLMIFFALTFVSVVIDKIYRRY